MSRTTIEWTSTVNPDGSITPGMTWNPVRGCSRVSEGCRNCYAERMAARFSSAEPFRDAPFEGYAKMTKAGPRWTGRVELIPKKLDEPLRWRKPRRVFVNSMSDLFHEALPDEAIDRVFAVTALAHWHTYQVLTKRAQRLLAYLRPSSCAQARVAALVAERDSTLAIILQAGLKLTESDPGRARWPLPNVWLGVSVEDQATADERIPLLLQTPAAVRFVSYEPALGPVRFSSVELPPMPPPAASRYESGGKGGRLTAGLDWVIVGGESGPGARPMDVAWIRSVVRQCREAGVACFVKQLGSHPCDKGSGQSFHHAHGDLLCKKLKDSKGGDPSEWPEDLRVREFPDTTRTP